MRVTKANVASTPEILKRLLGGELLASITVTQFNDGVLKAGTPVTAEGKVASTSDAVGVLLNDVYEEAPVGSVVKAFAVINKANAEANSGIEVDTYAASLPLIVFE